MNHYFDIEIAEKYGINCAVILQNIGHWVKRAMANESNCYDGNYWTYNSVKAYRELFPYLTEKQIRAALEKLTDEGIIVTGNYNTLKMDRTKWYALTEKGKSILRFGQMDLPQRANGFSPEGEAIPDINTNIKPDINVKKERKRTKANPATNYDAILFENVPEEELRPVYVEFIKMRKMIKKPLTDYALKLLIKEVNKLESDPERKRAVLERSISRNWQGVFPLDDKQNGGRKTANNSQNKPESDSERFMRELKEIREHGL